jgi:hypothetical protein
MLSKIKSVAGFCVTTLVLASCSSTPNIKSALGLEQNAPDEFRVVSKPNLVVPPNISATPTDSKEGIVVGPVGTKANGVPVTEGDKALLKNINPKAQHKEARKKLSQSELTAQKKKNKKRGILSKAKSMRNKMKKEPVVDPIKEQKRVNAHKKAKKKLPQEEVPVKQETKSVIDEVFSKEYE